MNNPLPAPVATHLLTTLAALRLRASPLDTPPPADLLEALADTFGPAPAAPAPTAGDLARAAIAVAEQDPATRAAIEAILDQGTLTYGTVETAAVVTAALAVLQTELSIERSPAGQWKVKLHKKPASDELLKALAHAIMRALGSDPGGTAPRLPK